MFYSLILHQLKHINPRTPRKILEISIATRLLTIELCVRRIFFHLLISLVTVNSRIVVLALEGYRQVLGGSQLVT